MIYFTYILQSTKDEGYYVGISKDIKSRLDYHNKGRARSTKNRVPFKIVYYEKYLSLKEARDREKYLKSYKGSKEKLTILENIK
jgi:putative endonuclease